jgi:pimeloyl-ACP methyl ester carboxylesterase
MSDVALEENFIVTNGVRLHVIQAGPANGTPVVMLHGFPEFWRGWCKQIPPLAAAGYRVVVPDQRGYNLSDAPKEVSAYRIDELVRDVVNLLDALERADCYLVGHDWGAAVAWAMAIAYPERVKKVVILNVPHPAVMLDFLRKRPSQMLKSWYIGFFQIPGLAERLLRLNNYAWATRALTGSSRPGTFSDEDLIEYKQAWKNSGGFIGMINWYRAMVRNRQRIPRHLRLQMPVRILWGKRDRFLSYEMAEASADFCDRAEVTLFDDATHWVQHEEPEAMNKALLDFLGHV